LIEDRYAKQPGDETILKNGPENHGKPEPKIKKAAFYYS
jgi:hypothetical protein